MFDRRTVLGGIGALATTAVAGFGGVSAAGQSDESTESDIEGMDAAVTFVRNVEEVRGHLTSSVSLLENERPEDAALHAGHGSDYFGPVLPEVRDVDPELATELRGHIAGLEGQVRSSDADEYEAYVTDEVFPLLDSAVEAVVPSDIRDQQAFDVRVMNALAGRIADEYTAAVPSAGTIDLPGEYWDGRGFLTRIEARYEGLDDFSAGSDALDSLRTEIEDVEAASTVRGTTLAFRVATAAAVPLPSARVEDRETAVTYLRNFEELRGHLAASVALIEAGHESAAGLHAGHGGDYITALLPAVMAADTEAGESLLDLLLGVDDRIEEGADAYTAHINDEVLPAVADIPAIAVPSEYTDDASVTAAVAVALAGRVEDEYTAAVTDEEVIELYGEYWDARGFLTRIETLVGDIESELDEETEAELTEQLETLRTELETAAPPAAVADTIEEITELLSETAEDA
jgi:hypothetical protein